MLERILNVALVLLLGLTQNALAQDSGFLSDYSGLEAQPELGVENVKIYLHPDAYKRLEGYQAVMIDQPELIVAADSKVKSMKPDEMVQVAEAMRTALARA